MSKIIPPLLSSSPPPIVGVLDEDEEDDFGDFTAATDVSYGCDALSLPSSPVKTSTETTLNGVSDNGTNCTNLEKIPFEKDFQDKRKSDFEFTSAPLCNGKNGKEDDKYNSSFQYFSEIPPDIVGDNNETVDDEFDDFQDFIDAEPPKEMHLSEGLETQMHSLQISEEIASDVNSTNFEPEKSLNEVLKNEQSTLNSCSEDDHNPVLNVPSNSEETFVFKENGVQSDNFYSKDDLAENLDELQVELSVDKPSNAQLEAPEKFPETELYLTDDDSFGDFEEPLEDVETSQQEASEKLSEAELHLTDDDSFDDFKESRENFENVQHASEKFPETKLHLVDDDSFGDFEQPMKDVETFQHNSNPLENPDSLDDFGGFESTPTFMQDDPPKCDDIDDTMEANFGDFESQVFEAPPTQTTSTFASFNPTVGVERDLDIGDDDFDDFTAHSETSFEGQNLGDFYKISDVQIALEKAKEIVVAMFPPIQEVCEDYTYRDFTTKNVVFSQLKDITDTSALSYQWSKSTSQKCMLHSLNIDSRNILYGLRWNESIPRYAATLGFQPLEPVKFDAVTPSPTPLEPTIAPLPSQSQPDDPPQQLEIPLAQFDWVSSGLTNPLENSTASTMLLDLEQLVATLDIQYSSNLTSKSLNSSSPVNDNDEWDFWLNSTPKVETEKKVRTNNYDAIYASTNTTTKNSPATLDFDISPTIEDININSELPNDVASVNSLQFTETVPEDSIQKDAASDFSTWQSSAFETEPNKWSFNSHILRETHITNSTQSDVSIPQFIDNTESNRENSNWLKPVVSLSNVAPRVESTTKVDVDEFADFQTGASCVLHEEDTDDEFTDFQSTLPITSAVEKPLPVQQASNTIPEPLQATILQPTISADAPTCINWPDPGLSDFDLQHIELNYKAGPISAENELPVKEEKPVVNKSSDEDDWSDFVSNQDLSKTTRSASIFNQATLPEMQLPIPHITEVQLPKQPVPSAVKQQEVFETKVLSNLPPLVQHSVQHFETYPQSGLHSTINSHNFQQDFLTRNSNFGNSKEPEPNQFSSKPTLNSSSNYSSYVQKPLEEPEDEWSDFMSSQPPPSSKLINELIPPPKLNFDWNKPPQFTSWSTSITPNIITNPGSFDSFQSYTPPVQTDLFKSRSTKKTPNVVLQPNRGPIQSISSVPDLEFISSKSKTWKK